MWLYSIKLVEKLIIKNWIIILLNYKYLIKLIIEVIEKCKISKN